MPFLYSGKMLLCAVMDSIIISSVCIATIIVGYIVYEALYDVYINWKCSLLKDDYIPDDTNDPQISEGKCPECKRSGKFTEFYVDPIQNRGKYRQCICGYVENLPEDII
jgi:hypothetical protein